MTRTESKIKRGFEVASEIGKIRKSGKNKEEDDLQQTIALSLLYIEKDEIEDYLQSAPINTKGLDDCLAKLSEA